MSRLDSQPTENCDEYNTKCKEEEETMNSKGNAWNENGSSGFHDQKRLT